MEEEAGDEDDEDDDEDDDESEGESAEAQPGAAEAKSAAAEPAVAEAHRAAVAMLRRRLVGVVSYEVGQRLGQRLLQVGLLGVRIRFQQCGVGSRLLQPLLQQRCEDGALDAAVVFADRRAVPFFNKHGFNDDPILNARYAEVLEPCARWSQQLPPPIPDGISGAHSSWASQEPLGQQLAAWRHARLLDDLHPVRTIWGAPRTTIWSFWS